MYFPLDIPPGVYRNGTARQAAGRWRDSNLIRWIEGALQPIGGWRARQNSGVDITVTGAARAAHLWRANDGIAHLAIGTHTKLYALEAALTLADITPAGFVTGSADASSADGYGMGDYGAGDYGVPASVDEESAEIIPATIWALDNFGEDLIAHATSDGRIFTWTPGPGAATVLTNAPTNNASVVVTAERFVMALGAGGDPRKVQWSDQEAATVWTAASTNQAGDNTLQTSGELICGRRTPDGTLLWTTEELWRATYIGTPFVYSIVPLAGKCSLASPKTPIVIDSRVAWMGRNGFWLYNGYLQPLPSEVSDDVFANINVAQISKAWGVANHDFAEATWFYPSAVSNEVDSYVKWNWRDNIWDNGRLPRLCGVPAGLLPNPILVDSAGKLWNHEIGFEYEGAMPYAESAPVEIGAGDRVFAARQFVPDETTLGDVNVTFKTRTFPTAPETEYGPYVLDNPTMVRFAARQVAMRVTGVRPANWRFGRARLEGKEQGRR